MKKYLTAFLVMSALMPVAAYAVMPVSPPKEAAAPEEKDFPVLDKLRGQTKETSYDYLGQRMGMDAWLLSAPNVMQVIYIPEGKKIAIVGGALIDADAKEIGSDLMKDFLAGNPQRAQEILAKVRSSEIEKQVLAAKKAKLSPAEAMWLDLAMTGKVTFGDNPRAPVVYAVLDPAAPETKAVWGAFLPLVKKNLLTVHIVPLALTNGDTVMQIASILGSSNPPEAWENVMTGGQIGNNEAPDPKGALGMKATVEFAQAMKLRQLPLLVYRLPEGTEGWSKIRMIRGMPKDWDSFLKELSVATPATEAAPEAMSDPVSETSTPSAN